jgi:hypothetical protein
MPSEFCQVTIRNFAVLISWPGIGITRSPKRLDKFPLPQEEIMCSENVEIMRAWVKQQG